MTKFYSIISKIVMGVGAIGLTTGGGVLIYTFVKKDNKEYHEPNIINKVKNFQSDAEHFTINQWYKTKPYLDKDGIEKLEERIRNDLGYGPEIYGLNSINLSEGIIIPKEDNGSFYETTKEIFVNTNNMRLLVPDSGRVENKVEVIFQIIFHEYGHFLASSYLKNNKTLNIPSTIYSGKGISRKTTSWNESFVTQFKNELYYDIDSPLNTHKNININSKDYILLASQYNAKNLFDISNGKNDPVYANINNLVMYPWEIHNQTEPPHVLSPHKLEYLYSMDELFARKYQQIGMVLKPWNTADDNWDGWISQEDKEDNQEDKEDETGKYASPFLYDTLQYQASITPPVSITPNNTDNWRYMIDAPYDIAPPSIPGVTDTPINSRAIGMHNLMLSEFGQNTGADISYITSQNNSKMINSRNYSSLGNGRYIRFGGYLKNSEQYRYVGYKDESGAFVGFPITIDNFTYRYKDSLDSQTLVDTTGEKKFYTTNEYIDGLEISGKQLFFANDEKGAGSKPLDSIKSGDVGLASNYMDQAPSAIKNEYYYANNEVGDVNKISIERGSWT